MKDHVSTVDLLVLGKVTDGIFPFYYDKLVKSKQITPSQYIVLKSVWDATLKQDTQVIQCKSATELSDGLPISTNTYRDAVYALKRKGLLRVRYRKDKLVGVQLSLRKMLEDMGDIVRNSHNGVSLFDFIYLVGVYTTEEVYDFGIKANRLCKKYGIKNPVFTTYRTGKFEVIRQPIFSDGGDKMVRQPIFGTREPIVLNMRQPIFTRKPITLGAKKNRTINFTAKKYQGLSDSQMAELVSISHLGQKFVDAKLARFRDTQHTLFTDDERDCLENLVPYYENLICSQCGLVSYKLLNNAQYKKRSKNWKALWKIYTLCKEKGWDYKVFLDSQFESFANWRQNTTYSYPLPNMLYSERAIHAFESYIYRNETSYQKEGYDIKAKAKNTGTFNEEVEKKIWNDMRVIQKDLSYWAQTSSKIFEKVSKKNLKVAQKTKAIVDHWQYELSVEYLATIPDILDFIGDKSQYVASVQARIDKIESLQNDIVRVRSIFKIAKMIEQKSQLSVSVNLLGYTEIMGETTEELW